MKPLLYLLMLILATNAISAVTDTGSVLIVDLDWNNGLLSYQDRIIKCGHSPDYALAPAEGYIAELQSIEGKVLTTFTFEIPDKEYREISDPVFKSITGGRVILNETQFAIVFPYYDEATKVVIYNPRKFKILEVPLVEERFVEDRTSWWWLLLLAILAGFAYYQYKKRQKEVLTKNF
ncbi:MAG: hypothetical protein O2779_00790 [Nanoarchaeota archaeon]|nr:hypothetical protein [Nanoarchaeota archaeon]